MAGSSTVGTAIIKLTFDGSSVKASMNKVEKEIEAGGKSSGKKFGGTWAVAAGNLIADGLKKVAGSISGAMSSAISRVDQLNNFPKVMTSLGYSAEEADASITKIGDSLDGLPTSLDQMSADVQKLAASMGNLAEGEINATTVGLGLNDMFLAGGKGTEVASAAMEQYNQMLANGKVDMQSWRSMVNAAPGQMNQLAESLLGAGKGQAELYKALEDGVVSLDDFNAAVVKLDQEGGEGFESFQNQAVAATGGIATQLQNIQTSLNKVVASALTGDFEGMIKNVQQLSDRIVAVAPTLIKGFTNALTQVASMVPRLVADLLPAFIEGLQVLVQGVIVELPQIIMGITEMVPILVDGIMSMLQQVMDSLDIFIPTLIEAVTNLITTLALQLTRPDFLNMILNAAVQLLLSLVRAIPQILTALTQALPQIIQNIVGFLLDPGNLAMIIDAAVQLFMGLVMAVPQILGGLLGAFGTLVASLWEGIKSMFGEFAANFGEFIGGIFKNAINGVLTFIENIINGPIDIINGFIGAINDAFGFIGVNLGKLDRISLPRLAQGGIATGATAAIIGEAGKEAVLPLENNTDNWAGLLAETLAVEMQEQDYEGKTINVYMTNEINNELDAQEIGRVMMQSIRRAA